MASSSALGLDVLSTQDPLYRRLLPIADQARKGLEQLRRSVVNHATDCESREQFDALSEYAAWEAFRTVCADPDAPDAVDTFDWEGEHRTLVKYAMLIIERDVRGRATIYGDWRRRSRSRKIGAIVDGVAHDAWLRSGGDPNERTRNEARGGASVGSGSRGRRLSLLTEYAADTDEQEQELHALRTAVRDVLSAEEFHLIDGHYWQGRSQRELAADLVATSGRYTNTPEGFAKAEVAINVAMSRARRKLARRLPSMWRVAAQEVA